MRKGIVILVLGFLSIICYSQEENPSNRQLAEQQIMQLRNGVLVVRLKTNEKSINAYRRSGKTKLADKLEKENLETNLDLMKAFLNYFNFSKVLFIKAKDTRKLIDRQSSIFLNGKFEIDSSINLGNQYFFVSEFGSLMAPISNGKNKYSLKHTEVSSSPSSSSAIFIMDTNLTQLKDPFPYYADVYILASYLLAPLSVILIPQAILPTSKMEQHTSLGKNKNSYDQAVLRLDRKLIKYFSNVSMKNGVVVNENPLWWEENNPNVNAQESISLIEEELIKLHQDEWKFKSP